MYYDLHYITIVAMIVIGMYAVMFQHNLIKMAIGIDIIESGANLLLIVMGYRNGSVAPIFTMAPQGKTMALPTPQALTLTAIVIGLATTAFMLSLIVMLYRHYGTLDTREIRRLKG